MIQKIQNLFIGVLSILIIIINNLDNNIKLKLFLLSSNLISKIIFLNIIFFSLLENKIIGMLLIILFFMILSIDKKEIKEEFISTFKNN
tara:strand:+ start:229 stop:495 length:267 start_codon:yes stop_codon:yes gene_type:complete